MKLSMGERLALTSNPQRLQTSVQAARIPDNDRTNKRDPIVSIRPTAVLGQGVASVRIKEP